MRLTTAGSIDHVEGIDSAEVIDFAGGTDFAHDTDPADDTVPADNTGLADDTDVLVIDFALGTDFADFFQLHNSGQRFPKLCIACKSREEHIADTAAPDETLDHKIGSKNIRHTIGSAPVRYCCDDCCWEKVSIYPTGHSLLVSRLC